MAGMESAQRGVRRRTVAASAVWVGPAMLVTAPAPAMAASGVGCDYRVDFTAAQASYTPVSQLSGVASNGQVVTIGLQSQLGACTEVTQANLWTRSSLGIAGRHDASTGECSEVYQQTGAPDGFVVLNQHASVDGCDRDISCDGGGLVHPSQDLVFSFTAEGRPISGIKQLEIDVYDISSVDRGTSQEWEASTSWNTQYWDTVGFDQAPSRIVAFDHDGAGLDSRYAGAGGGSLVNPFMRVGSHAPTVPGVSIKDTFVWDALSGNTLTMRYSSRGFGWQFIAIAGIRFSAPC